VLFCCALRAKADDNGKRDRRKKNKVAAADECLVPAAEENAGSVRARECTRGSGRAGRGYRSVGIYAIILLEQGTLKCA
jgi:hypothetical protein